ncbi:MAG: hypothetical protein ABI616_05085 [Pseudomonadota bacterium]
MSEAVDNLHAIESLVALVAAASGADAGAVMQAQAILSKMGLGNKAVGYKAEKLQQVSDGFNSWLGAHKAGPELSDDDVSAARTRLIREIEHLRKALARGAEGQD